VRLVDPQVEIKVLDKFLPTNVDGIKEGDIFRLVDDDGVPIIIEDTHVEGKDYAAIHSWRALNDAMIDDRGVYSIDAAPDDAYFGLVKYQDAALTPSRFEELGIAGRTVIVTSTGLLDLVGLGLLAPALVSSGSTLAVVAGFGLIAGCVGVTGGLIYWFLKRR
jgi:hypothetical protein